MSYPPTPYWKIWVYLIKYWIKQKLHLHKWQQREDHELSARHELPHQDDE